MKGKLFAFVGFFFLLLLLAFAVPAKAQVLGTVTWKTTNNAGTPLHKIDGFSVNGPCQITPPGKSANCTTGFPPQSPCLEGNPACIGDQLEIYVSFSTGNMVCEMFYTYTILSCALSSGSTFTLSDAEGWNFGLAMLVK
jgi:hypothetical protein